MIENFDISEPVSVASSARSNNALGYSLKNNITIHHDISSSVKYHLFSSKSFTCETKKKRKGELRLLAISSEAWRNYIKAKEDTKQKILDERQQRKNQITKRKEDQAKKKLEMVKRREAFREKPKVTQRKYSKQMFRKTKKNKIQCAECQDELISDVEEDDLKNIGCDGCLRWYHLKYITECGKSYVDVATEKYVCNLCINEKD
ncbi:hypothetical protein ABEB36_000239 [Hypothenemus hampei]|uniref:Uncharacterized protein n=1 Tax=Hypothenemus hampei TaxID=57062 RepID=A0ABD1FBD0_HYPHA